MYPKYEYTALLQVCNCNCNCNLTVTVAVTTLHKGDKEK